MASEKKSFVMYADWLEMFDSLPDDKAGQLIKHILKYINDLNPETDDMIIKALFSVMKPIFKNDLKKWKESKEQKSKAGKASAEARKLKRTYLYLMHVFNESENFLKFGTTGNKIEKEFCEEINLNNKVDYDFDLLLKVNFVENEILPKELENLLINEFSSKIYSPKGVFSESTNIIYSNEINSVESLIIGYCSEKQIYYNNKYELLINEIQRCSTPLDSVPTESKPLDSVPTESTVNVNDIVNVNDNEKLSTKVLDDKCNLPPKASLYDEKSGTKKKPRKPRQKKETSITHKLRLVFEEYYQKEKSDPYYYQAADGKNLTNIISKIKFIIKQRQGKSYVPTEKDLIDSWTFILNCLKETDQWIYDNLSLPNINSKFNELISKINDGRKAQTKENRKGASVEQLASVVSKHFNKQSGQQ